MVTSCQTNVEIIIKKNRSNRSPPPLFRLTRSAALPFLSRLFWNLNNSSKDYRRRYEEGSANVDPSGNFSIEVLRAALLSKYGLSLPNIRQEGIHKLEVTNMDGFICNRQSHWFAIRKINGKYWNLNSTLERPELISHFRLAAEIEAFQSSGYSVFCVVEMTTLPPPCSSLEEAMSRKLRLEYLWKEQDLLKGGKVPNANTGVAWNKLGTGMILGSSTSPPTSSTSDYDDDVWSTENIDQLTEDEMMQLALAASLKIQGQIDNKKQPVVSTDIVVQLTPEPDESIPNTIKIQFRLPEGKKYVRRFLSSDYVAILYAYVEDILPLPASSHRKRWRLFHGYPLTDMATMKDQTISDAKLGNELVQVRYD